MPARVVNGMHISNERHWFVEDQIAASKALSSSGRCTSVTAGSVNIVNGSSRARREPRMAPYVRSASSGRAPYASFRRCS